MDLSPVAGSWPPLGQILGVNILLPGDNAAPVALAAAGPPAERRGRTIMFGMVQAVVLRVVLSLAAVRLLAVPGLLLAGGLVLPCIAYGFFEELRDEDKADAAGEHAPHETRTMGAALRQIVIADGSMSRDNLLAVAGAAAGNRPMLIIGLVISILLVGVAATLLERYRRIACLGVALIMRPGPGRRPRGLSG